MHEIFQMTYALSAIITAVTHTHVHYTIVVFVHKFYDDVKKAPFDTSC